jgi:hypothetical protein
MAPTIGMQTMPTLTVLAVVGLALVALLFIANAKLEPVSPVITTSQRLGLPNSPGRTQNLNGATQNHTAAPAPAPDMSSPAVLAAQPKSGSDAAAKFGSAAREARAEAPTKKARVETSVNKTRSEVSPQEARVEASAKRARAEEAPLQETPPQNESVPQHTESQQHQFDKFSIKSY